MHRVNSVRSGEARARKDTPLDFLARLEELEQKNPSSSSAVAEKVGAGAPAASAVSGGGAGWMAPAGKAASGMGTRAKTRAAAAPTESADDVLAKLAEMNKEIDQIRKEKRERTPPEKHVTGGSVGLWD